MALSSFKPLNEIVLISRPASERSSMPSDIATSGGNQLPGPEIVLLLPWSDASLRNIEKYAMLYAQTFPGSTIIVVRTGIKDFFWRSERASQSLVKPVTNLLVEKEDDQLLVHVMSNAGAKQWCTIDEALDASFGRRLSNACTVIDSTPGRSHFLQTWAALKGSLPRTMILRISSGLILGLILCIMHLQKAFSSGPDLLEVIRARLNNPRGLKRGARRYYIFSESGKMVGVKDVEAHALEAYEKGWQIRIVKFEHSDHVGHFKHDPVRYKDAVMDLWYSHAQSVVPPSVKLSG